MQELEVKTYNFTVQGIGLIKSLEKEFPEKVSSELRQNIGNVSLKFMDAQDAQENENFAKNIRECNSSAEKSEELLNELGTIQNETFENQKNALIKESKVIREQLDTIIEKLIY
jgi:hypothetical protein